MLPVADVPSVEPDAEIISVMDRLHADPRRAVVVEDGRLQGILSISDVAKAVEIQQARGLSADKGETRRAGLAVWAVVGLLILVAGSALYHPPLVVAEPGPTAEVTSDISIEGAEIFPVNGAYLLTSVRLIQPSALRTLWAAMGGAEVFPRSAYVPSGVDPKVFIEEQREVFRQSQQVAAAAGAAAAGLEVTVSGTGAVVQDVVEDSPAEGVIEPGDVIVSIDGSPVRLATDLPDAVRARPSRTRFTIELERGESRETVELVSRRLSGAPEGTFGIGVFVGTRDFDVQLPFEVSFAEREIGGPSAGLAYALAVADLLDATDHARGRTVVATGTVDGEGRVGAVGGVPAKAIAALDAGADLFLVPQGEIDQVGDVDLAVRAVASLQDALRVLGADS
jgi:PDZ domain-containing protein